LQFSSLSLLCFFISSTQWTIEEETTLGTMEEEGENGEVVEELGDPLCFQLQLRRWAKSLQQFNMMTLKILRIKEITQLELRTVSI
jgi:hypothetical protein